MIKGMLIMLIAVGCVFGGIYGYHSFGTMMMNKHFATMKAPPATVSAIKAVVEPWQARKKAVGTLRALHGVEVTTEVPGLVQEVLFKSGDNVEEGQVMVRLNTDTEAAQLRALQASADLARTVYFRDRKQLEVQAVSRSVVDNDVAELKVRQAMVAQQQQLIAKKLIRAPFTGRLGITTISRGQYLNAGEKIASLEALDSVYVDFYLPQQELASIKVGQLLEMTTDAYPGRTFSGKITAVNSVIDQESRNVHVEASVMNATREFLPGMYVAVSVTTGTPKEYITLPQAAIQYNPYGETVYLVQDVPASADDKALPSVKQVFVATGDVRGDQVAVLSGVKENDMVVTSGQLKLHNGSTVIINNQVQPGNDPAPVPQDK